MGEIDRAVDLLRAGSLVAFPTETVYGLGADARQATAIARVFAVKGRPITNPLIVHVADQSIARRFARIWPETASLLARAFWPGPLTLVLPKADTIVPGATAGQPTVGLRVPDHPLALRLLSAFDGPVAAPSANRSNRISPTTAEHVRHELGDSVDLILDGGPCRVGIESTVLDLTGAVPSILRPGQISLAQIANVIGKVHLRSGLLAPDQPARSPGQQPMHYAPRTPAFRFDPACAFSPDPSAGALLITASGPWGYAITLPDNPERYANGLYAALRSLDERNLPAIYIELPSDTPEWAAIRDRLFRATRPGLPAGRVRSPQP